ncbi:MULTISPECIES: hypothetical protein [Pseudomonas]|uniref:hypothetical protein n=1 Tax=Pseudomonas TaxID=286 RepID=UPI001865A5C9|nr:hypothetical protein [Pseudomonas lundensis]
MKITKNAIPYVVTVALAIVVVTLTYDSMKAMAVALAMACNVAYIYARWQREPESLYFIVIGIFFIYFVGSRLSIGRVLRVGR